MGNEQGKFQGVPTPAGIQSMDESLQKKFSKGIQFNSKGCHLDGVSEKLIGCVQE